MGNATLALGFFAEALAYVRRNGLDREVEWQRRATFHEFGETDLLRQSAWVILCSGFRVSVVAQVFDYLSLCFCDWESADAVVSAFPACRDAALASFAHRRKLDAIVDVARRVQRFSFTRVKFAILCDPIGELQKFPYIGKITAAHLAKNLGFDVAKPDRHLVRISQQLGYSSARELCNAIAADTGEPVKVIDLILWRYLADNRWPGSWGSTPAPALA
jgi:hypothetical protein